MTISFGLLGAGRIGKTHATAILGIPGTKLSAVFDPIDAAADHIVQMAGARRASVEEILADRSIDAVLICTPTDMHADQIELAAKAGKAIFCEKPVDLSADRVRACLKTVDATKAKLMIGFNRRFDNSVDRYVGSVTKVVDRKWLFLGLYAVLLVALAAVKSTRATTIAWPPMSGRTLRRRWSRVAPSSSTSTVRRMEMAASMGMPET